LKLKLDLHIHTFHSSDAVNRIEEINTRCAEQGLDGYAITDHDTLDGVEEALKSRSRLVVVPGLEVSALGAHILCLEPTEVVPPNLSMKETVERIHGQGATAILAHPYGLPRSWVSINQASLCGFDAVEVANSAQFPYATITGYNRKLAEELDLPVTGGSDSHIPRTIGRAYTVVESASSEVEDVIDAIKRGRTEAIGSGTSLTERLEKAWANLRKALA
jgi:predicted metal-dependent phosphoesterase TrpH